MMKRLGLPRDFELSQNYLFFWDKIERSNFFLETMIETASEPYDSRLVQWLLSQPVSDGGQWDMAVCVGWLRPHHRAALALWPHTQHVYGTQEPDHEVRHRAEGGLS